MFVFLDKISSQKIFIGNFLLVLFLGFLDYLTGNEWSFHVFYFLPIALVSWYLGKRIGFSFVFLCIIVWASAQVSAGFSYSSNYVFVWNMFVRLAVFLVINNLIVALKESNSIVYKEKMRQQKEKTIIETSQQMVGVIAEFISTKNSEIINWVNGRKNSGNTVPEVVDSASQAIGDCLRALTEIFYTDLFNVKTEKEEDYIERLQNKLAETSAKYRSENNNYLYDKKENKGKR